MEPNYSTVDHGLHLTGALNICFSLHFLNIALSVFFNASLSPKVVFQSYLFVFLPIWSCFQLEFHCS